MWNKLVAWHRSMEEEGLAVLADPAAADRLPPGMRKFMASKLAALSPFEREQLRAFSLKYYGWRAYAALAKFVAVCIVVGVLVHLAFPKRGLVEMIAVSTCLGVGGLAAFVGAWYNHRQMMQKKLRIVVSVLGLSTLGNIVGASVAGLEKGRSAAAILERLPPVILYTSLGLLVFLLLPLALVVLTRDQHYQVWSAQLQLEAERERTARELSESRLRMLRAQIEPHFLFNTLGAVQQLAENGAPRAAELTANLIAFLRASLSEMRTDRVNLRSDFELIRAYLDVMKTRLGDRLAYRIELPEALAGVGVPSMLLLTLVENAIKHGIEPAFRGGTIVVSAVQEGGQVRIRVQDDGVGMSAIPGQGHGLENIRDRLKLIYGDTARLELADGEPQGLLADVILPLESPKA
jgi:signal transduction histidine kinase